MQCFNTFSFHVHRTNKLTDHHVYNYDSSLSMGKSVLLLTFALHTKPNHNSGMVNNQTSCVIVKVIADYDYIYNVII